MPDSTFNAIATELKGMGFSGRIDLYLYCEPLLDERLPAFVRTMRASCPEATLHISTNGDMLTLSKARELESVGLDAIGLQVYDDTIPPRALDALLRCPIVWGGKRTEDTLLNARGGAVPHLVAGHWTRGHCPNPFRQLIIDAWGKAWLCCNDYGGEHGMGTFPEQSLAKLWESPRMVSLRSELSRGERCLPICQVCREGNPQ